MELVTPETSPNTSATGEIDGKAARRQLDVSGDLDWARELIAAKASSPGATVAYRGTPYELRDTPARQGRLEATR